MNDTVNMHIAKATVNKFAPEVTTVFTIDKIILPTIILSAMIART